MNNEEQKQVVQKKDFDILAQVISEQKLDDIFSMVWFKDWQGRLYEMRVNLQRFPVATKGTVIRVRSVTLKDRGPEAENTGIDAISVEDGQFTNILAFQPNFR